MRLAINNLHQKGALAARSWINDWPSHNHVGCANMKAKFIIPLIAVVLCLAFLLENLKVQRVLFGLASISTVMEWTNAKAVLRIRQSRSPVSCCRTKAWEGLVGQPASNQERVVGAFIQGYVDARFLDGDGGGDIEEIAEEFLGLSPLIFAPDLGGQEPIERTGHEGNLEVEINFEPDHGGEGVEVEELDGLGDAVFDEHAMGIACD